VFLRCCCCYFGGGQGCKEQGNLARPWCLPAAAGQGRARAWGPGALPADGQPCCEHCSGGTITRFPISTKLSSLTDAFRFPCRRRVEECRGRWAEGLCGCMLQGTVLLCTPESSELEEQQAFHMSRLGFRCFLIKLLLKWPNGRVLVGDTLCKEFSPHVASCFCRCW